MSEDCHDCYGPDPVWGEREPVGPRVRERGSIGEDMQCPNCGSHEVFPDHGGYYYHFEDDEGRPWLCNGCGGRPKRAFLICPVRGVSPNETKDLVESLEKDGWTIHWPPRDTNQDDPTGLRICEDNRQAIADAAVVFFVWDGKSQGCLFDLGMAFAMKKPVRCMLLPQPTEGKSFQNMAREWEQRTTPEKGK
jgi:hypothetical protein